MLYFESPFPLSTYSLMTVPFSIHIVIISFLFCAH